MQQNDPSRPRLSAQVMTVRPDLAMPELPADPVGAPETAFEVSPPYNREAEEATLGAVLIAGDIFPGLASSLKPSDFFIHRHGWIFAAFGELAARGEPIDFRTAIDELARMGTLEEAGGSAFLTLLVNQCPSHLHAKTYANRVKDCSIRRSMIAAAGLVARLAYNPKIELAEVLAQSQEAFSVVASEGTSDRFTVRDAAFALQPWPPIDYVVDGLITTSSVNIFYGEPGSKKTYSALSLAICVANGKPWLDFRTKQCPVLIIDEESGERRLSRRVSEALRGELCDQASAISYVSLANFKLDTGTDPVIVQNLIERSGAKLVIFDALADLMDGDENDKADVQPVFNHLRRIAESTDCAVLLIHHAGKGGGYRGSSAIKGSVDLMVQVSSESGSGFVNFRSEKNRDGQQMSWAAEAVWTEDQFFLRSSTKALGDLLSTSDAFVVGFLTKHGPSLLDDLKDAADTCSPEAARKAVYRLARAGQIVRTNPGEKGSKARYGLS